MLRNAKRFEVPRSVPVPGTGTGTGTGTEQAARTKNAKICGFQQPAGPMRWGWVLGPVAVMSVAACTRDNPLFGLETDTDMAGPTSSVTTNDATPDPVTGSSSVAGETTIADATTGPGPVLCGTGSPGELIIGAEVISGEYTLDCSQSVLELRGLVVEVQPMALQIQACEVCDRGVCADTDSPPVIQIDFGELVPGQTGFDMNRVPRCLSVSLARPDDAGAQCSFNAFAVREQPAGFDTAPLLMGANGLVPTSIGIDSTVTIEVGPATPCSSTVSGCEGELFQLLVGDNATPAEPGATIADLVAVRFGDWGDYLFRNRMSGSGYGDYGCEPRFSWAASRFFPD